MPSSLGFMFGFVVALYWCFDFDVGVCECAFACVFCGGLVCAFRCGLCGFADGGVGVVGVACCCGVASLWLLLFCGLFDFRCGLSL